MSRFPKTQYRRPGGWDTTATDFGIHPDGVIIAKKAVKDAPLAPLHVEGMILSTHGGVTPTRLGVNVVQVSATGAAGVILDDTNAATDKKLWFISSNEAELRFQRVNDVSGSQTPVLILDADGVLSILETTEPTAVSGYGKLWPEGDGTLWFQDSDQGDPHLVVGPAYNIMRFHGIADHTLVITAQAEMTKFDGINALGLGDEFVNVTGSVANDELTVGAAVGIYDLGWFASLSAQGGASREVILNIGVELFSPISVTGATGSGVSPIVLTIAGLNGTDGLLIEIVGVGGNNAANGSAIINASTATTIELYGLNRVAKTGDGAYTSGGQLTIYYPSFNLAHTEVSQNTLLLNGGGSTGGGVHLNDGDKVALYASNLDGTNNLDFAQAVFGIRRISGPRSGAVPLVF